MSVDMQRQRLRHLVSSAVHELWKKETGSVSSVFIEGTICITVHGGRTTVVQLSEHYAGLIPEAVGCGTTEATKNTEDDDANGGPDDFGESKSDGSRSLIVSPSRNGFAGGHDDVFCDDNEERLGYLARKYSPARRGRMVAADMDTNNNQKGVVDAERNRRLLSSGHCAANELDFEEDSTEIDVDDEEDIRSSSSIDEARVGSRILDEQKMVSSYSGTAVKLEDSANDSAVQDMSISFETSRRLSSSGRPEGCGSAAEDLRSPLSVSRRLSVSHHDGSTKGVFSSPPPCGLDNGSDLLLSSPQDLTAQVRNVIRQRLIKQLSPFEALHQGVVAAAAAAAAVNNGGISNHQQPSASFVRPHSSPYYRALPSPLHWSTPLGSGNSANRETPSEAARRLMTSSFGTSPSSSLTSPINHQPQMQAHHHHHHMLSPNSATPASVSTPVGMSGSSSPSAAAAAMQFGASLHNLLGMRAAAVAAVAAAAAGGQTLDLKMRGGAIATSPISGVGSNNPSTSMLVGGGDLPSTAADGTSSTSSDAQKIYRCDYCFKTFLFKSKYHEHLPVHTSARPFQCHLCTRTYKYKYDLRVHLRTHLGIPTKSTVCPFCAGRFATNKLLRQHMRSAHSDNQVTPTSTPTMVSDFGAGTSFSVAEMKSEVPPSSSSAATIATASVSSSMAMSDGSSIDDSTSRMSDPSERKASVDDEEVDCDDVAAAGPVSGAVVEKLTIDAVS